jgi:hypothetical protein
MRGMQPELVAPELVDRNLQMICVELMKTSRGEEQKTAPP